MKNSITISDQIILTTLIAETWLKTVDVAQFEVQNYHVIINYGHTNTHGPREDLVAYFYI
jgi:hypothetical protein